MYSASARFEVAVNIKGLRKEVSLSKPNENAFPPPDCPLKSYCVRIWFPKLPLICELAGF